MRAIERRLNRFVQNHPRFGIPNLMTVLVIGTVVVYLLDLFSSGMATQLFSFDSYAIIKHFQLWRLVTFLFIPMGGDTLSIALSLYFYWWMGSSLEREWGTARFNVFYFTGVVFNIIFGLVAGYATVTYLNLSLFFAFAALYPETRVLFMFFIPIKIKWLAAVDAFYFLLVVARGLLRFDLVAALLPIVAIFNFLLFFWGDFMAAMGYRKRRFEHQHSRQTVNFKQATRRAYQQKGYIHKCAVCGKTDTDHPELEFRYCSKCNGYYCYCMEHIGSHVHIE